MGSKLILFAAIIILGFVSVSRKYAYHMVFNVCNRYLKQAFSLPFSLPTTTIISDNAILITTDVIHQMYLIAQIVSVDVMTQCLIITAMEHVQSTTQ